MSDRPILLIDGANLFIRSWAAFPTMSSHGHQMGGCIGFLKSLKKIVTEIQPSGIYVAWEGGGSQRRRNIYSDYKLGRRPEKVNRFYGDDIPDSEENRKHQLISLLEMLKNVPVCQVYASDCEGDDIIAFMCNGPFRDRSKVIVSSDKDLYQLLNDNTKLYSLHKKRIVDALEIFDEYRIKTKHFALAKALCGDPGDNIDGIKGLGFKTAAKKIPLLGSDEELLLDDVISYCQVRIDESSVYKRIVQEKEILQRNWKLVYLDGSMLSATQVSKVQHAVDTFIPRTNRISLIRLLIKEGVTDFDVEGFFYAFNCIEDVRLTSGD